MFLIVTSSMKLVVDTYTSDLSNTIYITHISEPLDLLFTTLFALEAATKTIAFGFVLDKGSYLRETWNILDFFIAMSSVLDLSFTQINVKSLKVLRLLRTLRPLRFISHNSEMKTIVIALLESIGHIVNVVIVIMVVWLMFAILGVSFFSGKFFSCSID